MNTVNKLFISIHMEHIVGKKKNRIWYSGFDLAILE